MRYCRKKNCKEIQGRGWQLRARSFHYCNKLTVTMDLFKLKNIFPKQRNVIWWKIIIMFVNIHIINIIGNESYSKIFERKSQIACFWCMIFNFATYVYCSFNQWLRMTYKQMYNIKNTLKFDIILKTFTSAYSLIVSGLCYY